MQIPSIPHMGQKKPWNSIPRINWAHPMTRGLISYGYDVGCGPIDLVTGGQRTITNSTSPPFGGTKSSKYGSGLASITGSVTTGLYTLPSNANINNLVVASPYSFACGLMLTATPGSASFNQVFTTCDATVNTPIMIGVASVGTDNFWFNFANGANQNTAAGALKINTFQTLLGVALTGTTAACYVDGVLNLSPAVTTTSGSVPTSQPAFFGLRSSAGQNMPSGFIYYGALWKNRALKAPEARLLHDDPYCFLIYPEDEMFAELGTSAIQIFPVTSYWQSQPEKSLVASYG